MNDTLESEGYVRAKTAETVDALRAIVRQYGARRMLLVGPPAMHDLGQKERIRECDEALHAEADRLGVRCCSVFEIARASEVWWQQVRAGEGAHPDAEGYAVLADVIALVFLEWLRVPIG